MAGLDRDWAKEVLEWWRDNATACLSPGYSFGKKGPSIDALRKREHMTRVAVQRVMNLESLPALTSVSGSSEYLTLAPGIETVKYALGVLGTEAEIREHAGSSAPIMAADQLHATIWDPAAQLWADGHFAQAVQRAATFLNAHVQDRLNRHDVSDATLMQQAFSPAPPEVGKPRLRWPGKDDDLTVKAMRGGILNFSQGCFMAIRNPATHGSDQRPRQIWLEQLATLSTLARWIDECEVLRV